MIDIVEIGSTREDHRVCFSDNLASRWDLDRACNKIVSSIKVYDLPSSCGGSKNGIQD